MEDVIDRMVTWARLRSDVRAALVLGSWARDDFAADRLSDLDLTMIVSETSAFLSESSWLLTFGDPCLSFVEPTAVGNFFERRVSFRDGRDVDFSLLPLEVVRQMAGREIPVELADVFRRGFRILVDKDGLAAQLVDSTHWPEKSARPPLESVWRETSHDFLYHVLLAAKKATRGELWVATSSCNGYLKNLLLRLIEWHAKARGCRDTWHKGRFLEHWAASEVLASLPSTFAQYSLDDVRRALTANLQLYEKIGHEIANVFGYEFPEEAYSFAVEQLQRLALWG